MEPPPPLEADVDDVVLLLLLSLLVVAAPASDSIMARIEEKKDIKYDKIRTKLITEFQIMILKNLLLVLRVF